MLASVTNRLGPLVDTLDAQLPQDSRIESDGVHLDAAIEWLCHSQDVTGTGGSAATYNLLLGWEDPYPETSGYIVPTLFEYADRFDDDAVRERAVTMAEWTLSTQHDRGSFPGGTGDGGEPNAFNTGQIILGLAEAYRQTGDHRYRDAVRDACDWLVTAQSEAGHWATYDYQSQPHVYSTRVAWAMLVGDELLSEGTERYRRAARRNLEWVLDNQLPNGWFKQASFEAGEAPFLHTIAYTIRGLVEGGRLLDDDEIFEGGKRAADRLLAIQSSDGALKGSYDEAWTPGWYHCLTGNAQMAIVWARLYERTRDHDYLVGARTAVQFCKRHQSLDGSAETSGGIPGSYPIVGNYMYLRYPNWAAKFFADALLKLQALDAETVETTADVADADADVTDSGPAVASGGVAGADTGSATQGSLQSDALQLCLLTDGEYVFRWVAEAIEELLSETDTEISLVVVNEDAGTFDSGNIKRGKRYPAYATYRLLSGPFTGKSRYDDRVHLSDIDGVRDAEWIRTYPDNVDGLWNELPPEAVERIEATSDIVFRRGFGLIRGDVLTATEHGVISYHHGDPKQYRGGPAGFWEFMHDEPTAGMMVQSLTDELDAGIVQAYSEVDLTRCDSWSEIQHRLYTRSTHLLTEAVETIQSDSAEPMEVEELGPVNNPPSAVELGQYAVKELRQ
jgi:hypothetical protein